MDSIPDFNDPSFTPWLNEAVHRALVLTPPPQEVLSSDSLFSVCGSDVVSRLSSSSSLSHFTNDPLGLFALPEWRRLVSAAFAADWASYSTPDDRTDFERHCFVLSRNPSGLRVWCLRGAGPHGGALPVGYSFVYVVSEATFARFESKDQTLADRLIAPTPWYEKALSSSGRRFAYLFSVSITAPLRRTEASRRLVKSLAADISEMNLSGLAAITVSPDGRRVCGRFGMVPVGSVSFGGLSEDLLVWRASK